MKKVFIHGLGQTPSSWDKVISQLNLNEDAICPEIAKLMKLKENRATYSSLYSAFSNRINEEKGYLSLCGLSLGGVLALNYAIDYPEKVKSLVLIAAQYKMPKKLLKFQNAIFRFMPNSMFEKIGLKKGDFIELSKSMMELDFSAFIHKIKCPTLIIYGNKDKANMKASIELADKISDSELKVLNGIGHEVNMEAPKELAEILKDFFLRNE
ncbi:MAG: alpha/beta hydrolase [Clostridiaceae bacterium]|nr:alpha/beta hydrolase [Clostridiaceae bacterium]